MSEVRTNEQKVVDLFRADGVDLGDVEKAILSDEFLKDSSGFSKEARVLIIDMCILFDHLTRAEQYASMCSEARKLRYKIIECKNKLKTLAFW